jgi:hypothetical protein
LAACGGSSKGDDGGADEQRPTKAEWIAKADALCKQAYAEADALPRPKSQAQLDEYLAHMLAIGRRFDPKFAALEAPEGDEETIEKLVRLNEEGTRLLGDLVQAVRTQDGAEVERIVELGSAKSAEFSATARAYGSKECAKAGDTADLR